MQKLPIVLLAVTFALGGCGASPRAAVTQSTAVAVTTTTEASVTTTTAASPYRTGQQDKDFAVASLQEGGDLLGQISGTIRITNVGTQTYTVIFTVTFFATADFSGAPIGSATGSAQGVAPGQTVTESLLSQQSQFPNPHFYYQFQVDSEG